MKYKNTTTIYALLLTGLLSTSAFADKNWEVRVGYGHVGLGDVQKNGNSLTVGGGAVPPLDAGAANNKTLLFDISRRIGDTKWKGRFFGGIPPEATLKVSHTGAGLPPVGTKLGKISYAPAVLSATYDLPKLGKIQPYIGGGINYTIVYNEKDGLLKNVQVSNGVAPVVQIGADMEVAKGWTVGLDVRKIFLDVDATANLGTSTGAPVAVDLQVDPLVVMLSVGKSF